jgi:hypothetical protein
MSYLTACLPSSSSLLNVYRYVRVTLGFLSEEDINGADIVQSGVSIGLRYDSRSQGVLGGSVAEVSFKPEMDMKRGLVPESLIPTLSLLGSDP